MPDKPRIEPLPLSGVADYHIHPDYSVDARGTIEEYCDAAIERNLAEICFTTHYDSNPDSYDGHGGANFIRVNGERLPVSPDSLEAYVEHVRRAHDQYFVQGVSVKLGLEFGWYPGCEEAVIKLKERYGFDYMLCGIHEIENVCFCCSELYARCFERYSVEQMAQKYFGHVLSAIRSGLFDTIAHLDYYRKYGRDYYGDAVNAVHQPYMADVFTALKESGTGLEINTAALRKGLSEYYPRTEIINLARREGVAVRRLGSDAHRPEQIGFDFEAASALAPAFIAGCDD